MDDSSSMRGGTPRVSASGRTSPTAELDDTPVEPTASSSSTAYTLEPGSGASSSLRERSRSPYVGSPISTSAAASIPPRKPAATPLSSSSDGTADSPVTSSLKGKQRASEEPEEKDTTSENPFACHICLEVPATDDAVLSKCGHLFCWSDLSAWLESNPPTSSSCPVCKSQIKDIQEDVIPIYSGGVSSKKQIDPRTKPRPKPRVTPAPPVQDTRGVGLFSGAGGLGQFWDLGAPAAGPGGWTVQAGVFPFPGLSFGWSNAQRQPAGPGLAGGGTALYNGVPIGAPMTPEMQEAARRQQRNALIAFVVMILLFSLLATIGEMDID